MTKYSNEELLEVIQSTESQEAWSELFKQNQGLIYQHSKKEAARKECEIDLCLSHAHEAFVKAARTFDASKGFKFSTYLSQCLVNCIKLVDPGGPIYIPPLAFSDHRFKQAFRATSTLSLNAPIKNGSDEESLCLVLEDPISVDVEDSVRRDEISKSLEDLLGRLTERERFVIHARFWEGKLLREVGKELGITREGVRQIEARALDKLRSWKRFHANRILRDDVCDHVNFTSRGKDRKGRQRYKCSACGMSWTAAKSDKREFRLPQHVVNRIKLLLTQGESYRSIAKIVHVSKCTVSKVAKLHNCRACKTCGNPLPVGEGVKRQNFCSDECQEWKRK